MQSVKLSSVLMIILFTCVARQFSYHVVGSVHYSSQCPLIVLKLYLSSSLSEVNVPKTAYGHQIMQDTVMYYRKCFVITCNKGLYSAVLLCLTLD